jgi:DNA-binding IclR family transcriptional regulator
LDLLEAVGREQEMGVSELAREFGLPVSTAHSLIRTLASRHYLVGVSGRYRLGPAVTALSAQWDPTTSLPAVVEPLLQQVSEATGHTSSARILVGDRAPLIGLVQGPRSATLVVRESEAPPALRVPTGCVLVAFTRGRDEWPKFVDAVREPGGEPADDFIGGLLRTAQTGVALVSVARPDGPTGIAVPVWSRGGLVLCSLGCSAPAFLCDESHLRVMLDVLWAAAVELSARLGCEPVPLPTPADLPTAFSGESAVPRPLR